MFRISNFCRSRNIALNRLCGAAIRHCGILLPKAVIICLVDSSPTCPNNSWRKVTIYQAYSHTIHTLTATILTETYCNRRLWEPQSAFNILLAKMCRSNCLSQPRTTVHRHQMQASRRVHRKHGNLCAVVAAL